MNKEKILTNYNAIPYVGCHIWDGCLDRQGYGVVRFRGKNNYSHRLIYEFAKGSIPEGVFVCHHCDTPSCMNPDHLFLGTQKDNMADCINKGRKAIGSDVGLSKLTESQVLEIRTLIQKGIIQREIAKDFGVHYATISDINTGRTWEWLE